MKVSKETFSKKCKMRPESCIGHSSLAVPPQSQIARAADLEKSIEFKFGLLIIGKHIIGKHIIGKHQNWKSQIARAAELEKLIELKFE